MTKNTAYMYMKDGIRANAIAPGGIASEIATSMGQPNPNGYGRIQPVLACDPKWAARKILPRQRCSWQAKILLTSVAMFW